MNKKIISITDVANAKRSRYFPFKKGKIEIVPVQYEELNPFLSKNFSKVFPSLAVNGQVEFSKKQKKDREILWNDYRKLHWECFFFKYDGKIAGWFMGEMDDYETFYMRNTGILPEFQGKKIYSLFFPKFLDFLQEIGYQRVSSQHSPNNAHIYHLKLRLGFMIVGSENHERFGQLVKMVKIFDKKRNKIFVDRYC